jgi:tRNA dimethylallyltransferase
VRFRVLHLCGPTASGKSDLAERLAEHYPAELISVDSAQVYRGMDIGSAKPDAETRARLRYHLLDLLEPEESYSAAQFVRDAEQAIQRIHHAGKLPILVGGTMLYFRALGAGLSDLPAANPTLRLQLQQRMVHEGLATLHAELARIDPVAAARIHANDQQRTLRALEVYHSTGQPLSLLQNKGTSRASAAPSDVLRVALYPEDRSALHARIERRFLAMLEQGLLTEVARLRARPQLTLEHPSMRSVGYRQAWEHLAGGFGIEELKARGIAATRQLAKRQITWLRSDPGLRRLDLPLDAAFAQVRAWLSASS